MSVNSIWLRNKRY